MPATSAESITRYLVEATPGVLPTGNPKIYRVTDGGLNQSISTIDNNQLRSDRGRGDTTLVSGSVSGSYSIDLSFKTHDEFLEALFASTFSSIGTNSIKTITDMVMTTATNVITSATNLLPLMEKGQYFQIAGATTAGNNGIYKCSSTVAPTTGSVTVDPAIKAIGATDTTHSNTLSTARLKQGNSTPLSFTIERELSDVSQFFTWSGSYPTSLSLTFADKAAVTGKLGFMALKPEVQGVTTSFPSGTGSAVAALTTPRFNSVTGATVLIDGVSMASSCIESASLNITANARERRCLGSGLAATSIGFDQFTITGSMSVFFGSTNSATLYNKKLADLPLTFSILVKDANGMAYAFTIPRAKITKADPSSGGLGSDVILSIDFTAATDTTFNTLMMIDRLGTTA